MARIKRFTRRPRVSGTIDLFALLVVFPLIFAQLANLIGMWSFSPFSLDNASTLWWYCVVSIRIVYFTITRGVFIIAVFGATVALDDKGRKYGWLEDGPVETIGWMTHPIGLFLLALTLYASAQLLIQLYTQWL